MKFPRETRAALLMRRSLDQVRRRDAMEALPGVAGVETQYAEARSFWHCLFPLGEVEEWRYLEVEGDDDNLRIETRVKRQEYSTEWLGAILENWREFCQRTGRAGFGHLPLPVSYNHNIEGRMFYGYPDGCRDELERAGSLYALHLVTDGDGVPAGLWGLIEWTPRAMREIEDGTWMGLSPTTFRDWCMTDGTIIEGESLVAVGLVDRQFIDTIGTARARLPADALEPVTRAQRAHKLRSMGRPWGAPAIENEPAVPRTGDASGQEPQPNDEEDMATKRNETAPESAPETGAENAPMQSEEGGSYPSAADIGEAVIEAIAPMMERMSEKMERMAEEMKGYMSPDERSAEQTPAQPAADDATVDVSDDALERKAEQAAQRAYNARFDEGVKRAETALSEGRIKRSDFAAFARAFADADDAKLKALAGEPYSAEPTGRNTPAQPAGESGPELTTEAAVVRAAEQKHPGDARKQLEFARAAIAAYERTHGVSMPKS